MPVFGYARVSSQDQNLDRQSDALRGFGIDCLYTDKISGKNFNRPGYKRLVRRLREGDVLVIVSIDRLGRNYDEVLEEWRYITKTKKADVVVLDMPLLDTRNSQVSGITGTFIADLVLQLLSYVAQLEREHIKERQRQGIDAAMARGVKFGRPRNARPDGFDVVARDVCQGRISQRSAAARLDLSYTTFRRWFVEDGYLDSEDRDSSAESFPPPQEQMVSLDV